MFESEYFKNVISKSLFPCLYIILTYVLKAPVRTTSEANLSVTGENRLSPAEEITSRMITPILHLSQVCIYVYMYVYIIIR